ncbi:MAG: iron transporter [Gammaproteobacteria bacterium]
MKKQTVIAALLVGSASVVTALAAETPIGQAIQKNGMEIGAVYLQPVQMQPSFPVQFEGVPDAHIELDIHAVEGNSNGFGVGEWIPYLTVTYHLTKAGSQWEQYGVLYPMVASDGPHYGANVKFDGPGKYHLTYHIEPPPSHGFMRHYDKETGVAAWWTPFNVDYNFAFAGTGKKGGY